MKFSSINGYMSSKMWITANLIQLFTLRFCRRYWSRTNDPSGGMFDQMSHAARAVTANIAEGLGRHQTSRETEMRLLDVARASLSELYSDYYFLVLDNQWQLWERRSEAATSFDTIKIEAPNYISNDWPSESLAYIRSLAEIFSPWCECQRHDVSVNSLMILLERLQMMIETKMNSVLEIFKAEGGFTESLTKTRIETIRANATEAGAPQCPKCGKPMARRMIKKGQKQGQEFWGCTDYPNCDGTRPL